MHIITKKQLTEFWKKHPESKRSLEIWYKTTRFSRWSNFADLRKVFRSADQAKNFTAFNIGGNKFQLIAYVDYESQKVFLCYVLLHKDYDKNKWKEDS